MAFGAFMPLSSDEMDARLRARAGQGAFGISGVDPTAAAAMQMPGGPSPGPFGFGALPGPSAAMARESIPKPVRPAALPATSSDEDPPVPLPPERPAEFGPRAGDAPAPAPAATSAPAQAGTPGLDKFLNGLGASSDILIGIGTGLLSTKGFGQGLASGIKSGVALQNSTAATDLARAKQAVEQQKLARETQSITANAGLVKRAYPGISDEQAAALAANASNVQEALKIIRDGNHGRENDPAVIRMKAQAQAEGAAAGKPDETYTLVAEEERAQLGLPAGSYQKDSKGKISPVNPTGTTINMGAEKAQDAKVGQGYGDYQLDLASKGRNAGATLNTLALMEQAMNTPGFYSGVGGEGVKRANQFLSALGVKDAKAASAQEVFDALSNKVVLDGLGGSLGPGISNTDRDYIGRTAPTLASTPEGNRALIGVARALAQRQQEVAKLARDYAAKNSGRLDGGFDQVLDDFAAQNPLFPQARASATASAPQEPPQGAPQGTRRAPDGFWYAPDPRRPGKFVRVVQ